MRETETTKASFRGACYTASFLLLLTSIGLTVAAFYTTKSVHGMTLSTPWATLWQKYGALVALLGVLGYSVLAWLFVIIWIHTYWPDGWIYKKRTKMRLPQGGGGGSEEQPPELPVPGLVPGGYPMGMAAPPSKV
jgi:hypothetical protein